MRLVLLIDQVWIILLRFVILRHCIQTSFVRIVIIIEIYVSVTIIEVNTRMNFECVYFIHSLIRTNIRNKNRGNRKESGPESAIKPIRFDKA